MRKFANQRRALTTRDSLNNPAVPLTAAGFFAWAFGGEPTAAGELVTIESAFKQVTVMACMRTLADGIASLPLKVYQVTDGKGKKLLDKHPVALLLNRSPNDEMRVYSFITAMVMALVAYGACYVEIQRSPSTQLPIALWPLHPACTDVRRDPTGKLYFETTDTPNNQSRRIELQDMIYIPYLGLTGIKGMSLVGVSKEAIGLTIASEKFGSRFFGNNAMPGGLLTNTSGLEMTDEQRQLVKTSWQAAQSGKSQHSTAVMTGDWKYTPIGISPQDSQFIELRAFQRTEIAALFSVPPSKVGDTTK